MTPSPYRESTPRPDPVPRVRRRWAMRGARSLSSDWTMGAAIFGVVWAFSLVPWSVAFVVGGLAPYVLRWTGVEIGFLLLWALVFVTRERVS